MARVPGRLLATLLSNGTVVETFLPDKTTGNANPIRAKDIGTAERDFVWTVRPYAGERRPRGG